MRINKRNLRIVGVDDPVKMDVKKWKNQLEKSLTKQKCNDKINPKIRWLAPIIVDSAAIERTLLLTHHPEFVDEFARLPVDVVFAGHTHGGQVRIPYLLNGLYVYNQGVFPPFAGGIYELMPNIMLKDTSITHNPVYLGNL